MLMVFNDLMIIRIYTVYDGKGDVIYDDFNASRLVSGLLLYPANIKYTNIHFLYCPHYFMDK